MSVPPRILKTRQFVLPAVVMVVAVALAAFWIVTAGRAANTGFDITDEGYYLLSYRWWDQNPVAFTGVQYLYGPVSEWLGYDIVRLRLFRLVTVVVAHLVFGYSFMRWLRGRRPTAPPTKVWDLAGAAVVLAAGGMSYSWLPQSPGYNDVVLLGALALMSCVLWTATAVDRGRRTPFWVLIAAGMVIGVMVLAKWASFLVIALILAAGLVVLAVQGIRAVALGIGYVVIGVGLTALAVHLFVIRLDVAVTGILAVNRFIAGTSYSPGALLQMYWSTGVDLLASTVRDHWLLLVGAPFAVIGRWGWFRFVAGGIVAAGLVVSVRRVVLDGGAIGGAAHVSDYGETLLAAALVVLIIAVVAVIGARFGLTPTPVLSREGLRGWVMFGVLVLLPPLQSFGTNNPLYMIGLNAFAAWVAVMIAAATGILATPIVARVTVAVVTAASLVAVVSIAYTGLFQYPYRSVARRELTAPASESALKGLHLQPAAERNFAEFAARLRPYTVPPPAADPRARQDARTGAAVAGQAGRRGVDLAPGSGPHRRGCRGGLPARATVELGSAADSHPEPRDLRVRYRRPARLRTRLPRRLRTARPGAANDAPAGLHPPRMRSSFRRSFV